MLDSLHPNLLAFLAAFSLAASQMLYRDALRRLSPAAATLLVNFIVALFAFGVYALGGGVDAWPPMGLFWFALVGFCGNFLSRFMNYHSMNTIGLARTQVLAQTQPVWSALLALVFLDERLGLGVGVGTVGIVCGAILLVQEGGPERRRAPLLRYLVPILAAFILAWTPTMRKFAFALIPSASFGLAASAAVGVSIQLGAMPIVRGGPRRAWDRRAVAAALLGACINAFSALMFWTAIKEGEVVQVVPIRRLSVLFVLVFSWWFFRKQERITPRVVSGALLSVAGAAAIASGR